MRCDSWATPLHPCGGRPASPIEPRGLAGALKGPWPAPRPPGAPASPLPTLPGLAPRARSAEGPGAATRRCGGAGPPPAGTPETAARAARPPAANRRRVGPGRSPKSQPASQAVRAGPIPAGPELATGPVRAGCVSGRAAAHQACTGGPRGRLAPAEMGRAGPGRAVPCLARPVRAGNRMWAGPGRDDGLGGGLALEDEVAGGPLAWEPGQPQAPPARRRPARCRR
jgi:hypothetical protein